MQKRVLQMGMLTVFRGVFAISSTRCYFQAYLCDVFVVQYLNQHDCVEKQLILHVTKRYRITDHFLFAKSTSFFPILLSTVYTAAVISVPVLFHLVKLFITMDNRVASINLILV